MKSFITPSYTFTPGTSGVGKVNLTGISSFDIKRLVAIINQTDGVVIYSTANPAKRYTSVSVNEVTLYYDTSTMDAGDILQVIYESDTEGQTTSAASLGVALSTEQEALINDIEANQVLGLGLVGALNETAPASDTASSGLNGRLQRIAQRITSLIALFPSSLGQKTSANSFAVTIASDQSSIPNAIISGTITCVQATVGTSAVRATVSGSAPSASRKKLKIKPSKNNTGAIYLGSSSVTTLNGLEIIGPDRLEFDFDASDYYLISDTASQKVEIIEVV